MACCLPAPSHYLNQCWLIIGEVPWHSSQGLSLDDVKRPIDKTKLRTEVLKWHPDLPGDNELNHSKVMPGASVIILPWQNATSVDCASSSDVNVIQKQGWGVVMVVVVGSGVVIVLQNTRMDGRIFSTKIFFWFSDLAILTKSRWD